MSSFKTVSTLFRPRAIEATSSVQMSGVQSNQYYKAELHTKQNTQQRSDGVHMFCVPVRINFRALSKITF